MRRSFASDSFYRSIFTEYVQQILSSGERPIEFFVEGTRSRCGKALQPKLGIYYVGDFKHPFCSFALVFSKTLTSVIWAWVSFLLLYISYPSDLYELGKCVFHCSYLSNCHGNCYKTQLIALFSLIITKQQQTKLLFDNNRDYNG